MRLFIGGHRDKGHFDFLVKKDETGYSVTHRKTGREFLTSNL
jgi:predicted RecB family nuclease